MSATVPEWSGLGTDRGADILDNCTRNVLANSSLYVHGDGAVQVRKLDWLQSWPPVAFYDAVDGDKQETIRDDSAYFWSEKDLEEARGATVLLAADVVYSPELTQAFFEILDKIMAFGANKTLFLTLEKRYNFSVDELDVVANGYRQFRSYFHSRESDADKSNMFATQDLPVLNGFEGKFEGRQIPTEQVLQHIVEYERGKDLELWEITRSKCQEKSTVFKFSEG